MSISNLFIDNTYDLKCDSITANTQIKSTGGVVAQYGEFSAYSGYNAITNGNGDALVTVPAWDPLQRELICLCTYSGGITHTRPLTTHSENPSQGQFAISGDPNASFAFICFFKSVQ